MELDELVGKSFDTLTVLSWSGLRVGHIKKYLVYCEICSLDEELFPNKTFITDKKMLLQGKKPCGCGKSPKWSNHQNEIRVKRKLQEIDYTVSSFKDGIGSLRVVEVICKNDHTYLTSVHNILAGYKCKECSVLEKRKDDQIFLEEFLTLSKYPKGSTFRRIGSIRGGKYVWEVECSACINDEYTTNNLCTGVFQTTSSEILKGFLACRCSKKYRWSLDQRKHQVKVILDTRNDLDLITIKSGRHDSDIELYCKYHGDFTTSVGKFINQNHCCPKCCMHGFKDFLPAYFYVLNIKSFEGEYFTGFGITNEPKVRLQTHKRELLKSNFEIEAKEIFSIDGGKARAFEKTIKDSVNLVNMEISGFKREATFMHYGEILTLVNQEISKLQ